MTFLAIAGPRGPQGIDADAGRVFDTFADLDAAVTYALGQPSTVAEGDYLITRTGFAYQVLAPAAPNADITTSVNGVKINLLFDQSGLSATGWALSEDGVTDNAQRMAELFGKAVPVTFRAGDYLVTSTVAFPVAAPFGGGHISGFGKEVSAAFTPGRSAGAMTRVLWGGTAGGTLWQMDGQAGLTIKNMAFVGISADGATNKAGVGHQYLTSAGFGSGISRYENVSFSNFAVAVRCGDQIGDANCADLSFHDASINDNDVFLQVENDQGVNYDFYSSSANRTDRIAYFKRGGNLRFHGGNLAACGETNWCFEFESLGDNTYGNSIRDLRIEQNTKRLVKAVGGHVLVEDLTEAQSNQAVTMFDFQGTHAVVRGGRLVTHDAANPTFSLRNQPGGYAGSLLLDGVQFDVDTFAIAEWLNLANIGAQSHVIMRGCTYGANGLPLPDFSTNPAFGPVPLSGFTSGATGVTLSIFGLTRNFGTVCRLRNNEVQCFEIDIVGRTATNAVAFQGRRLAVTKNVAGAASLENSQIVGADFNPLAVSVLPALSVTAFDALEVTCTGTAGQDITWSASIRETASVPTGA